MSLRPKPEVENLKVCPHGGPNWAELEAVGLSPEGVLDFSVSSNPFPTPGLKKVLNTAAIDRYPDSETTELRQRLSERLGVAPNNILVGNGSTELIRLIALTYFGRDDSVLILEPTFGEYEVACQIVGARVLKQRTKAEDSFVPKIEETITLIRQRFPKGVFLCNPNSPTGGYLSLHEVEMILGSGENTLFVLDEAFVTFADENWSSINLTCRDNVIIVRSMTKDYGLAGLRLGYVIAHEGVIESLHRVRPPWHVNVIAQKAGVAALKDADYLEWCKQQIRQAKQFLMDELSRIGFTLVPSKANYFLVRVGNAKEFRTALLKHGILVRNCSSFGLPEYVRIAPRTMPECRKLITIIKELKLEGITH